MLVEGVLDLALGFLLIAPHLLDLPQPGSAQEGIWGCARAELHVEHTDNFEEEFRFVPFNAQKVLYSD